MRIGIFDSGIGGLTILKELLKFKPNNHYIYYGDNINLPYGDKTKEELTKILDKIMNYFINLNVDLVIIACGTMSSIIDKSKYNIKIIDIIEPTIRYFKKTDIREVLLLGTKRTIEEGIFKSKLEEINIKVYDKACSKFTLILERKSNENINYAIDEYLNEFKKLNFDYVILGCTHFALIEKEIENYLNKKTLNIGEIIANEIENGNEQYLEINFGKVDEDLKTNVGKIINININQINIDNIK